MSRTLFFWSAVVVAVMVGRAAFAEDPPKPLDFSNPEELFKQLDKNKDGQLTPDEIPPEHRRLFERLLRIADKNGDGKLSLEEFVAGVKEGAGGPPPGTPPGDPAERRPGAGGDNMPNLEEMFTRLDKNNDGKVTADEMPEPRRENFKRALERLGKKPEDGLNKEEFVKVMGAVMARRADGNPPTGNRPEANPTPGTPRSPEGGRPAAPPGDMLFRLLDKNGDGVISEDEISAAAESLHKFAKEHDGKITREAVGLPPSPPPGAAAPGPNAGRNPGAAGGPVNSGEFLLRRFKAMDKNGDGKVSKDEAEGMLKERFDEIDTNHDGFIDEAEVKQLIEKLGERFRQNGGQRPANPTGRPNATPDGTGTKPDSR